MDDFTPLGAGLSGLPMLSGARTRSVSPENPTGEKGKGAMAVPDPDDPDVPDVPDDPDTLPFSPAASDLGQGWKVSPFVKVAAGETHTVMDVAGPGVIQHIWLVADPAKGRSHIIRFYWDGEETPSIETPVSDFFAVGHNRFAPVNSLAVICNAKSAFNCYWPMPFRNSCRITFSNEDAEELRLLTYQITYQETEVPEAAGYLHAQWRRAVTERSNPDYVIADGIRGQGKYVGTFLAWTQLSKGWFGEGEIKFYLDGDTRFPTICGTGTEDYLCGSYGFPENYNTAYVGRAQVRGRGWAAQVEPVPLAHHGSDPLRQRPARHHPGARLVAQPQVPAAGGRHRLRGLLVPERAARPVPETARPRAALAALGDRRSPNSRRLDWLMF